MLTKYFILLLMNYILIIHAQDDFSKTELKHHNTNKMAAEEYNLTSVFRLGRQRFGEYPDREQAHSPPGVNIVNNHSATVSDEFNENVQPLETRSDRAKRASGVDNSKLIVFGKKANINAYPWLVYLRIVIRRIKTSFCGGSLISSKYVVTAAHCLTFELQGLNDIHVILGEYDTTTYPRDCVYFKGMQECVNNVEMFPEKVTIHERYNRDALTSDIALIRLRGIAPNSESISPIPLPTFDIDSPRNRGKQLGIAGWGSVYQGGPAPSVKRDTRVNLVPFRECREMTWVPEGKVCAIGQSGQDSCHGDSGGPLMAYSQGNYFLVGIVSGKAQYAKCGSKVPTTYTNVYQYLDWIKRNMRT